MKTLHLEKNGIRGLSISESFKKQSKHSILAGVVMSNEFLIDGFVFEKATLRGDDITEKILVMYENLKRDDISYLLLPGTILSMYNIVDIDKIFEQLQIPIIAVNSKESSGLYDTLQHHFPNNFENKIKQYEKLGTRQLIELDSKSEIYLRMRGCTIENCKTLLDKITLQGSIPEPLRVSQTLAKNLLKTTRLQ
tara:strand:- start:2458 stop:3039 length:582 start_codon:yes stop_codon:yes gene_type:complete